MAQLQNSKSSDIEDVRGPSSRPLRIGIFYPADPVGYIPGGIDTVIRGILKWAPIDLDFTLFGATSDSIKRPVNHEIAVTIGERRVRYVPLTSADPSASRGIVPLTIRYLWALRRYLRAGRLQHLDILDFHRIEALALFTSDVRPKNVMIHQDMEVIRNKDSDIGWRHAPWLYEIIESRLLKHVNHVFCVRRSAVDRYQKLHPVIADRFSFLPTWFDPTVFHPIRNPEERQSLRQRLAERHGIVASARILVWVGRLDRQKDPMLLLDVMQTVLQNQSNVHLLMIGDGIMRAQVEDHIKLLDLHDSVSLLGAIPPLGIAELLQVSDLFVLSSAYEGMPIVVLEALASGVPVVTTDVGEVRLVVHDGIDGFVVADRTPAALARAVSKALNLGDSMRGAPCVKAASAYIPEYVLRNIYDNHRNQGLKKTL